MLADFRVAGDLGPEPRVHPPRVERAQPDPAQPLDPFDLLQEPAERARRRQVVAVGGEVDPGQDDLPEAAAGEVPDARHDRRPAPG